MIRRPLFQALAAGCVLAGQPGCIPGHSHLLRHESEADRTDGDGKVHPIEEDQPDPHEKLGRYALKPSQRPGALSDTGAEIERSLGIGR